MSNVIDFAEAGDTLRQMREKQAANAVAGEQNRARVMASGQPLKGPLDSSDDWEMYHVYETKEKSWEVWFPFDNAAVITFPEEEGARNFARATNALLGSGVATYDGEPPIGPAYA